eukprot:12425440-Karenia_brevis.AAC.1
MQGNEKEGNPEPKFDSGSAAGRKNRDLESNEKPGNPKSNFDSGFAAGRKNRYPALSSDSEFDVGRMEIDEN